MQHRWKFAITANVKSHGTRHKLEACVNELFSFSPSHDGANILLTNTTEVRVNVEENSRL